MPRESDPRDQEYVTVNVTVHAATSKAALLSDEGYDESSAVWIARSQIQTNGELKRDTDVTIGMKRWLARKEGFVHVD